jgi:hypothetical protein
MTIEESEFLKLPEAAKLACVEVSTMRSWRLRRLFRFFKIGGRVVVKKSDLLKFISDGETPALTSQ